MMDGSSRRLMSTRLMKNRRAVVIRWPNNGSSNELCSSLAIVPNKFTVLCSLEDIEQNNFEIITQ